MLTNKTVLVSLIGKGTAIKNSKGYTKAKYYFDETQDTIHTSFFGSALYKVLSKQGYDIDKWLIFGTSQSSWSELLYLVDEKHHDEMIELYDMVYDEENDSISKSLLLQWEALLHNHIPGIRLILVDPRDYEIYINHMINEIPRDKTNVVLDITHAFRHMPVVIAFSLMALKHIKDISNIKVYYGAFELKENRFDNHEPTPVLNIDFINTLVSYSENLAIFSNSGYFPNILEDLGVSNMDKTYFWLEMNRQPRSDLESINKTLEEKAKLEGHEAKIAEHIKKEIEPLIGASLDRRMIERARFFFEKKTILEVPDPPL
jgi:cell division protein DivIC